MAIYLTNRDGGKTDEEGHYQFLASGFSGNVLDGLTLVQQNPLSMKLNLTAGNARIPYGGYAYSAFVKEGETHEVTFGTANPSNPRIDRVVLYVDRTEARQVVTPNNPDIVKVAVVAGTPAGTPTRPSDANVNTAVSNNPWIDLADVRVNTGVTQITTANVTDKRVMASAVLAPNAVTADKIDFTTLAFGNFSTSEVDTGFKWIDGRSIYKKTLEVTARPQGASSFPHGISNLRTVIDYKGASLKTTGTRTSIPYVISEAGTSQWQIQVAVSQTNLEYNRVAGGLDAHHMTIWYTKN